MLVLQTGGTTITVLTAVEDTTIQVMEKSGVAAATTIITSQVVITITTVDRRIPTPPTHTDIQVLTVDILLLLMDMLELMEAILHHHHHTAILDTIPLTRIPASNRLCPHSLRPLGRLEAPTSWLPRHPAKRIQAYRPILRQQQQRVPSHPRTNLLPKSQLQKRKTRIWRWIP